MIHKILKFLVTCVSYLVALVRIPIALILWIILATMATIGCAGIYYLFFFKTHKYEWFSHRDSFFLGFHKR